tara:strand:+ start:7888 stop:8544 length:657 start_codon:yes stop_codon:yes gene_type:complete
MDNSKPLRIYIEGNIGSGKTTFCKYLTEYFKDKDISVALEPLDRWLNTKDKDGTNILDLYYKDSAKYSFVFQMTTFITRCQELIKMDNPVVISERSNFTDKNIFVQLCIDNGWINSIEETVYNEWFDWLIKKNSLEGDLFVYLRTDHTICKERIGKRGRVEEEGIPIELLKSLEEKHDKWLMNYEMKNKIVFDNNSDEDKYEDFAKIIEQYINGSVIL